MMILKRTRSAMLILGVAAVLSTASAAQALSTKEIEALVQSSYTKIDGKRTPELVPYHSRMNMFFGALPVFEADLRRNLSAEDFAILKSFSDARDVPQKEDAAFAEAGWKEIASRAEGMNALEIAGEMKRLDQRIETKAAARYRRVLSSLSPQGQQFVERYAFEKVRPSLSVYDPLVIANAAPDYYKTDIVESYKLMQEGKWPPTSGDTQAKSKVFKTEAGESGQIQKNP
jgi:hypothetical protein